MKKLILASALAPATAQAEAAPMDSPSSWYPGTWTCTVANAPKLRLVMTLSPTVARAAVREYPYHGKPEYQTLTRFGDAYFSHVKFMGPTGFLELVRSSSPDVVTGKGRIGFTLINFTCARFRPNMRRI